MGLTSVYSVSPVADCDWSANEASASAVVKPSDALEVAFVVVAGPALFAAITKKKKKVNLLLRRQCIRCAFVNPGGKRQCSKALRIDSKTT